jgi:hypothetical protein
MGTVKVVAWEEVAEGLLGCELSQPVFVVGHLRQRRWRPEMTRRRRPTSW